MPHNFVANVLPQRFVHISATKFRGENKEKKRRSLYLYKRGFYFYKRVSFPRIFGL